MAAEQSSIKRWADEDEDPEDTTTEVLPPPSPSPRLASEFSQRQGHLPNSRGYESNSRRLTSNNRQYEHIEPIAIPEDKGGPYIVRVNNLDYNLSREDVASIFQKLKPCGVELLLDTNGRSKGLGSVTFTGYDEFQKCLREYHGLSNALTKNRALRLSLDVRNSPHADKQWSRQGMDRQYRQPEGDRLLMSQGSRGGSSRTAEDALDFGACRQRAPTKTVEPPKSEVLKERPRLLVKPRTAPIEEMNQPATYKNSNIFGAGRAHDEFEYNRKKEIERVASKQSERDEWSDSKRENFTEDIRSVPTVMPVGKTAWGGSADPDNIPDNVPDNVPSPLVDGNSISEEKGWSSSCPVTSVGVSDRARVAQLAAMGGISRSNPRVNVWTARAARNDEEQGSNTEVSNRPVIHEVPPPESFSLCPADQQLGNSPVDVADETSATDVRRTQTIPTLLTNVVERRGSSIENGKSFVDVVKTDRSSDVAPDNDSVDSRQVNNESLRGRGRGWGPNATLRNEGASVRDDVSLSSRQSGRNDVRHDVQDQMYRDGSAYRQRASGEGRGPSANYSSRGYHGSNKYGPDQYTRNNRGSTENFNRVDDKADSSETGHKGDRSRGSGGFRESRGRGSYESGRNHNNRPRGDYAMRGRRSGEVNGPSRSNLGKNESVGETNQMKDSKRIAAATTQPLVKTSNRFFALEDD